MKILQPFYYENFKCIGGKCENTCCSGWQIHIDKKSFEKYKKIKGDFGKKVSSNIKRNRKEASELRYGKFILNSDNKNCPLLNENNLCELYINEGEEYLCTTCRVYPRVNILYNDILERNLTLSCPEVARKIVDTKDIFSFEIVEEPFNKNEVSSIIKKEKNLYNILWEGRNLSIDIAQFSEIPLKNRLIFILFLERRIQECIDTNKISNYEKVIDEFRNEFLSNYNKINIDKVNNYLKTKIIFEIIQNFKVSKLTKSISILKKLVEGKTNNEVEQLISFLDKEFTEEFKDREYIFENYMVQLLYTHYMESLRDKNLHKNIAELMLEYSIIRLLIVAKWSETKKISNDEIVEILYIFSRYFEHNKTFMEKLYKFLKFNNMDTVGYLTTLIY